MIPQFRTYSFHCAYCLLCKRFGSSNPEILVQKFKANKIETFVLNEGLGTHKKRYTTHFY